MLAHLIKEAKTHGYESSVPKLKEKLGQAFVNAGEKAEKLAAENAANPDGLKFQAMANKAYQQASNYGVVKQVPAGAAPAKPAAAKPAAPKPSSFPAPTAAEIEKAKKNVPLQLQYVPGAPTSPPYIVAAAQEKVDEFNKKYAGKDLAGNQPALIQKVNDFKTLQAAMAPLAQASGAEAEKQKKAAAEKQSAANKAAAEALKAQQAAAKAKNQEYMKALGISETEASGFDALVDMMSESSSKADLIEKFKSYQVAAEKLGYPISGFQYALIRNYIDGGYKAINKALRANSPSVAQHVYARLVNNAIDKLPKYTGTVVRGTTLDPSEMAHYKPGHVVTEHGFTSTGVGYKFGGNVHYTIKAHGMRGGDFSTGANTGEKEVLFKAKTQFLVHKVEKKGGTTYIEMEEVEGHG
jgi:hypothetical protein